MADSFGKESSGGALGIGVTGQGGGASLLPTLANSVPGGHSVASGAHSSSNLASPPPAAAAHSGLTAFTATTAGFGNTFTPGSSPSVVAVSPTLHASSPLTGVGLGVGGVAGAGLLSQIHATSWDPTLSTDWDNEKASQQCILRIKR
ncbi:ubiquitin-conjugating enzyme E2 Z [Scomber scombrus]|uniref:Ubiquitin-conjugating enzyme E2 Z n=3 Tax=Scomber scombrus TaxID=13677 RepID=A0AAV1Q8T8_SCOSC